jgi:hypothetical protein
VPARGDDPPEPTAMPSARTGKPAVAAGSEWQVRFDGGHQQRYLADRRAVLRYVLAVAPQAAGSRFEVYAEAEPVRLADGSPGGRQFALAEVIDLGRPGEADRLRRELAELADHDPPHSAGAPGGRT